ncbi:Integrin alpha-PS2-like protein [Leptotrombidium deliense]|uniref:Integrin alpha-PS2-like protein n=1 Tax=Leptotrombidium deliense TaxID=299467 RepID=A0A443SWK9_9ACAR|nr:Integrin alpha-PS2-like protein [Leptotrombidium deliense]
MSTVITVTLQFAAIVVFSSFVNGFNLDIDTALIHRGPTGSYYGFSVAQHKDRGESWLLIGAPLAQTNQPTVEKGGKLTVDLSEIRDAEAVRCIWKCGPASVIGEDGIPEIAETKSLQWFGATVSSSGETGRIVACAPRYVYHLTKPMRRLEPLGMCFISTQSFIGIVPLEPCKKQGNYKTMFSFLFACDHCRTDNN